MLKINKEISIIIPVYNEEKIIDTCIQTFLIEFKKLSNYKFNLIIIDDGSNDKSYEIIRKYVLSNNNIKSLKLSKNYGWHIAISAGLNQARDSDAVIVCPVDDYYMVENLKNILNEHEKGYDIVWTIRKNRSKNFFSNFFSSIFYIIFKYLSGFKNYPKTGTSAFFLISKKVCKNFYHFMETNRVVNMLIFSMGYSQSYIYTNEAKPIRKSKYNFFSKLKIAIDSIVSYSYVPMRIISTIGIIVSILSFIYMSIVLKDYFFSDIEIEGWTTIVVLMLLLGGLQLLGFGILGEYIWRIFNETKKNPLYLVDRKDGFNSKD